MYQPTSGRYQAICKCGQRSDETPDKCAAEVWADTHEVRNMLHPSRHDANVARVSK